MIDFFRSATIFVCIAHEFSAWSLFSFSILGSRLSSWLFTFSQCFLISLMSFFDPFSLLLYSLPLSPLFSASSTLLFLLQLGIFRSFDFFVLFSFFKFSLSSSPHLVLLSIWTSLASILLFVSLPGVLKIQWLWDLQIVVFPLCFCNPYEVL